MNELKSRNLSRLSKQDTDFDQRIYEHKQIFFDKNIRRSNVTPVPGDNMSLKIKNSMILKAYRPSKDGLLCFSSLVSKKKKLLSTSQKRSSSKKCIKLPKIK